MHEKVRLALSYGQLTRARHAVAWRTMVEGTEVVRADGQRRRAACERGWPDRKAVIVSVRLCTNVFLQVPQPVKVRWEDVEQAQTDEERRTRDRRPAHPHLRHLRVHAWYPIGQELKSERSSRYWRKWVRSLRRRLIIRVGTYSGVERFGAKGRWLYIERTEGNLRMSGRCGGWLRQRRRLRNEAMSGSVSGV